MPKNPKTATAAGAAPGTPANFTLQMMDGVGAVAAQYSAALPVEWQNKLWDSFVLQIKDTVKSFKKGNEQPLFVASS